MIDLILKDIQDPHVRENFFRLTRFLNSQIIFEGDFDFYDVTITQANLSFKVKHGLTFIPQDIVMLSSQGDYNFYFRYQEFDRQYIYITASGPCKIRFLAGKLSNKTNFQVTEPYPIVPPGSSSLSPGPAGRLVITFNTDLVTQPLDLVVVSGINTVTKISSNSSLVIPQGIFGVCYSKPTPTTAEVLFMGLVSGYAGFSPGSGVFVSTSGTPTNAVPSTGMVQQIGMAVSGSDFVVNMYQPMRRS